MQVNITNLIDDAQCYQTVRELRWPDGIACPSCQSTHVIKRGFDDTEPVRQRYECHDCDHRFDEWRSRPRISPIRQEHDAYWSVSNRCNHAWS